LFEILKGVLGFTLKIIRSRAIFAPKMDATECKVSRLTLAIRKVQILKNKNVYSSADVSISASMSSTIPARLGIDCR
jgi:hypothetical protein